MSLLIQIIREIRRYWWLILVLPVLVGLMVLFLTNGRPLEYQSDSTLYLNLPTQKGLSVTNEEYKQFEIHTYFQNIIELSKSRKNLERIRLTLLLESIEGKTSWIKAHEGFPFVDTARVATRIRHVLTAHQDLDLTQELDAGIAIYMEERGLAIQGLSDIFSIQRQSNSNYLKITVKHPNPFHAAYFNELLLESMLFIHKDLNKNRFAADRDLFERLVEQAKVVLDEKVLTLEQYKIEHRIINLPEHTKAIVNEIVQLEREYARLSETTKSRKQALSSIQTSLQKEELLIGEGMLNQEYVTLKQQIQALNQQEDPNREQLRGLVKTLAQQTPYDIRGTKKELVQQYLNFKLELEMTEQLYPLIQAELQRMRSYAAQFAPFESNIGTMEREIQTAQESYLILVNKLNMAKTVEQSSGEHELRLIDAPTIPIRPSSTKRKMLVIAASLVSGFLVLIYFVVFQLIDKGMWATLDVKKRLRLPVLAGLPSNKELSELEDETLKNSLQLIKEQQYKAVGHFLAENPHLKQIVIAAAFENEGRHELALAIKSYFSDSIRIIDTERSNSPVLVENTERTLTILPPISMFTDYMQWKNRADVVLYTIHSGRVAEFVDQHFIETMGKQRIQVVLHGIPSDRLDDLGVRVNKSRSFIRVWLKRIFNLQFTHKPSLGYVA